MFKYVFGTIVEIDEIACFKIEKEGKLIVYVEFYDRKTKKSIVYESNLKLNKKKSLTEI